MANRDEPDKTRKGEREGAKRPTLIYVVDQLNTCVAAYHINVNQHQSSSTWRLCFFGFGSSGCAPPGL